VCCRISFTVKPSTPTRYTYNYRTEHHWWERLTELGPTSSVDCHGLIYGKLPTNYSALIMRHQILTILDYTTAFCPDQNGTSCYDLGHYPDCKDPLSNFSFSFFFSTSFDNSIICFWFCLFLFASFVALQDMMLLNL
jgi:hypothetical protein